MQTRPWTMLLMMLAGWLNRHQQDVIEYLREENKILREKIGKKRIILNDNQRMRLAHLGKRLGRKVLQDACCAFSPDTVLMWHRKLVAMKYSSAGNTRPGRRRISAEPEKLIIMFARKNKTWGSRRIKGALKHLGYKVCHTTIDKVLIRNGYDPSPDRTRKTRWSEFLKSHWESLAAIDFFTTEIYPMYNFKGGLMLRPKGRLFQWPIIWAIPEPFNNKFIQVKVIYNIILIDIQISG